MHTTVTSPRRFSGGARRGIQTAHEVSHVTPQSARCFKIWSTKRDIDLIITDVDGTLLNSDQKLTERTVQHIRLAEDAGVPLMIATGKAYGPWTNEILPALASPMPQVYLQGLFIRDVDGNEMSSRVLDRDILCQVVELAAALSLTLVLYSSDRIICQERNHQTDRLIFYGEPTPEGVGPVVPFLESTDVRIHKCIFMADDDAIAAARPVVQGQFRDEVSLTSAISGMLEVLPANSSKGRGVEFVLNTLNIAPERCMALGDGENDVEMLRMVGLGIAVGNATEKAKEASDIVLDYTNDQDAVAEAISRYILS
ncbi:Endoribonuclease YBEY [Picochlorum sp. SENEW3]|nr:Endoribonuclease YBEY [Picochlorum sp. SENEW3]